MYKPVDIPLSAFTPGVLNQEYHTKLISNIREYAKTANIPVQYIWSILGDHCLQEDFTWVKQIRHVPESGMVYIGQPKDKLPIEDIMMAITGTLVRNYVDARMMTLQSILNHIEGNSMPMPTVLLIPNFFLPQNNGGKIATWEVSSLLSLLLERTAADKKTILYVSNPLELEKEYGTAFKAHLTSHYKTIEL